MLTWITANIGTILVGLLLLVAVVLITLKLIKDKRKGRSSCGCGCADCALRGKCGKGR